MRTTLNLAEDVAAAVDRLRRERGGGLSDTVNELLRVALRTKSRRPVFSQRSEHLGLKIDVTDIAEAIEQLEGPNHR